MVVTSLFYEWGDYMRSSAGRLIALRNYQWEFEEKEIANWACLVSSFST